MLAAFGIRTYTHLNATTDFLMFQDHLALPDQVERSKSLVNYLTDGESDNVEVKASAFMDVNRWIKGDGKLSESDKVTNDGILRAIVAFLNSSGGTIVIGALETLKYVDSDPNSRLEEMPLVGVYRCCGVDMEMKGSWDSYELRLRDIIASRIKEPAMLWYTLRMEEYRGRTLCLVSVREPDRGPNHGWYYLYPQSEGPSEFYVRDGNKTLQLDGPEADRYRREKLHE
jgi:predicted HTH transcriptional regulator